MSDLLKRAETDAAAGAPPSRWAWLGRLWRLSTGRFGLIVVIVVFFTVGILGWLRQRFPERFGHRIDDGARPGATPGDAPPAGAPR